MKFAISSCWNSHRHDDGYALLKELAGLGFRYVELSHGTRISLVPGILKGIEDGLVKVASVHNFCPLPVGVMGAAPNLYEPSSANRRERVMWLNNTIKTVEFAHRVDCDRVVLHSGSMRFFWRHPEKAVDAALEEARSGEADTHERVNKAVNKGLKRMRRSRMSDMARLLESYEQVADTARQHGVKFGIENREGFTELPLDEDMQEFIEELEKLEVFGYWHDTGHARLKEELGLVDHRTYLTEMRKHLLGFHLHDVSAGGRDHQVPGSGVIDWDIIASQVRTDDVVVMEMSPRLTAEQILTGRQFLLGRIPALGEA